MPADKMCFVIAPIGAPDSPTRKRSDQVLKYIIKPAAEQCGFTTLRADQISEPGIITSQVIQHVIDDPMVVADLTGHNPNVFYELAIRHALRRPYVQIIEESDKLPFDVAGVRSIQFTHTDLDSVNSAKSEIEKQMRSMMSEYANITSPVTVAVDLLTLTRSNNPEDRRLGEVLTAIAELSGQVASLRHQMTARDAPAYSPSGIQPLGLGRYVSASSPGLTVLEGVVPDLSSYVGPADMMKSITLDYAGIAATLSGPQLEAIKSITDYVAGLKKDLPTVASKD